MAEEALLTTVIAAHPVTTPLVRIADLYNAAHAGRHRTCWSVYSKAIGLGLRCKFCRNSCRVRTARLTLTAAVDEERSTRARNRNYTKRMPSSSESDEDDAQVKLEPDETESELSELDSDIELSSDSPSPGRPVSSSRAPRSRLRTHLTAHFAATTDPDWLQDAATACGA